MRTIKFRAWDKKEEKMCFVLELSWFSSGKPSLIRVTPLGGTNIERLNIETTVILQFTGLKDKNGKEIYEGDILKDDQEELLEVKFGKLPLDKGGDCVCTYQAFYCKCYGKLGRLPMHECENIGEWMEVVGNIYENKDLLKEDIDEKDNT